MWIIPLNQGFPNQNSNNNDYFPINRQVIKVFTVSNSIGVIDLDTFKSTSNGRKPMVMTSDPCSKLW